LHDPVKAAELLGRYHGMFSDKVEHSGEVTQVVKIVKFSDAKGNSNGNTK